MADMIDAVKKAAVKAVLAGKPVHAQFGTVEHLSPLQVSIDQKIILRQSQLVQIKGLSETQQLEVGDSVALIRVQGGQTFIILGAIA